MKILVRLSMVITICFGFLTLQIHAQKASESIFLLGEWSMKGPSDPKISDTISLIRESLDELKYPRWMFEKPDNLRITHYYDPNNIGKPQEAVSAKPNKVWSYDASTNLLKIHSDTFEHYFKVIPNDKMVIYLIRIK
jgi:hypothetical protein